MWDSYIPLEDVHHTDSDGVVTATNKSHREMLGRELLIPVILQNLSRDRRKHSQVTQRIQQIRSTGASCPDWCCIQRSMTRISIYVSRRGKCAMYDTSGVKVMAKALEQRIQSEESIIRCFRSIPESVWREICTSSSETCRAAPHYVGRASKSPDIC